MKRAEGEEMQDDIAWVSGKCRAIREAWKLIVLGALAIGLLGAVAVVATNEPVYISRMVLPLSARTLGLIKSDADLVSRVAISAEMSPGSGFYTVSVVERTPREAQIALQKSLDQVLTLSRPSGSWRERILAEIELLNGSIANLRKLSTKLGDNAGHVSTGNEGEMYARAFVFLLSDIERQEHRLLELKDSLEGLRADDVVVRPTLPTAPEPRGLLRKLIVVGGAALLLMCLFVALRDEWFRDGKGARPTFSAT